MEQLLKYEYIETVGGPPYTVKTARGKAIISISYFQIWEMRLKYS